MPQATVTGWGTLSSEGNQPTTLQKVNVDTMSNSQCTTGTQYRSALSTAARAGVFGVCGSAV